MERDSALAEQEALSTERDAAKAACEALTAEAVAARQAAAVQHAEVHAMIAALKRALREAEAVESTVGMGVYSQAEAPANCAEHSGGAPTENLGNTLAEAATAAQVSSDTEIVSLRRDVRRLQEELTCARTVTATESAEQSNERTLRRLEQIRALKAELVIAKEKIGILEGDLLRARKVASEAEATWKEKAAALKQKTLAYVSHLKGEHGVALEAAQAERERAVAAVQSQLDAYRAAAADEVALAQLAAEAAERAAGLEAASVRAQLGAAARAELMILGAEIGELEATVCTGTGRDGADAGRGREPPQLGRGDVQRYESPRDSVEARIIRQEREEALAGMREVDSRQHAAAIAVEMPAVPMAPAPPGTTSTQAATVAAAPYPGLFCSL
eukprot:scaffold116350_cov28-Tisochrysis_lutea.AAC.1